MAEFSDNVARLEPSPTLAITARAKAMQAAGEKVINLSAGEPSFPTPKAAADGAAASVEAGLTGYPPTAGLPVLRDAIASYTAETSDSGEVDPGSILVSAGVKQVLYNLVYCLFGEGDEVLIPAPYWPSYSAIIHLSRATPVEVPLDWSDGFRLTAGALEEFRTGRTRGLLLNSPSNPSGAVTGLDDLAGVLQWAGEHDVWVLSDEIYRRLYYEGGSAPSVLDVADRSERVVAMDGVSKAFSMPGWRIGWGIGPADVMRQAADLQSQTTSGAAGPSQYASAAILDSPDRETVIAEYRDTLDARRQSSLAVLEGVAGIEVINQPGAIYHYLRLPSGADCMQVAESLLVEGGVATIPGNAFGTPGYLRMTYAGADEPLAEGVRRIAEFFGRG
jgi:aspartate/methionine/tyrosine aminotransferase